MRKHAKTANTQTFRLTAPAATSVLLVGDFTEWQRHAMPMRREEDGVWTISVGLEPGRHTYRFIVDGEWCDDPGCTLRLANPFGSEDMVREAA